MIEENFSPCLSALDGNSPSAFDEYVKFLLEHPLFTISQKSHELFHSGMFAWMIKSYPAFAAAFFTDNYIDWVKAKFVVETEIGHRDISIILDDKYYVIENKFKSFYAVEQLKRYQDDLIIKPGDSEYEEIEGTQSRMKEGVVLGLSSGIVGRLPGKWQYLSYYELLPNLCKKFQAIKSDVNGFHHELIRNYLEFLDAVLSVVSPFRGNMGETTWMARDELPSALLRSGLEEFIKLMLAHSLCEHFAAEYISRVDDTYGRIYLDCPYNYGGDPKVVVNICPWNSNCPLVLKVVLVGNTIVRKAEGVWKMCPPIDQWVKQRKCRGSISKMASELYDEVRAAEELLPSALKMLGCEVQQKVHVRR